MKKRKLTPEQFTVMAEFLKGEISSVTAAYELSKIGFSVTHEGVIHIACNLAREWVQKGVVYL